MGGYKVPVFRWGVPWEETGSVFRVLTGFFQFSKERGKGGFGLSVIVKLMRTLTSTVGVPTVVCVLVNLLNKGPVKGCVKNSLTVVIVTVIVTIVYGEDSAMLRARNNCGTDTFAEVGVTRRLHCLPVKCFGSGDVKRVSSIAAGAVRSLKSVTTEIIVLAARKVLRALVIVLVLLIFS